MIFRRKDARKDSRFRRAAFQEKLEKARHFQRKPAAAFFAGLRMPGRAARIFFGVVLMIILFFLTIAGTFRVDQAVVAGGALLPESARNVLYDLGKERAYLIPKNHILILTRRSLEQELREQFPEVRSVVHFRKMFPDKVEFGVEKRMPEYVWQSGGDYFLLDREGFLFQRIVHYDPSIYGQVLITDISASGVGLSDIGIKSTLNFINDVRNLWEDRVSGAGWVSFSVPAIESPDVFVKTEAGWEVYFDHSRPAAVQLRNLQLLLDRQIDPATQSGLSYIDLRLPEIAYYCYKDAPCAPSPPPSPGEERD